MQVSQTWQDGKRVVVARDGELPPICVRCGELGTEQITRKVSWSSPWLLILVLAGVIVYAIVVSIVAKRSRVTFWLCDVHAAAQRRDVRIGWAGLGLVALSFIGLFFGGALVPRSALGVLAVAEMLCLVGGALLGFYGYYRSRIVRSSRIDDRFIWLKGVSPVLRSTQPQFAG